MGRWRSCAESLIHFFTLRNSASSTDSAVNELRFLFLPE